ncbi:MaoC/PaaZ C-terminal domain-containing protein [Rhizobium sp. AN80A]|uniref:MaoC/PaaZ C-terminal domain-containing protein n=1 Tax=Rhizobium sp. AN80A TaxID=3040673 RepID=UPI0024B3AA89|nr:MaoC/PaaZ C-terminal domain-containing protein [Rhizobium sp. AN80A]
MRMLDRYALGERTETGSYAFTEENIIRFATRYDPQRFHVDRQAARESLFGDLCASGWHTCAGWMTTFVAYWIAESRKLASEGHTPPKLGPAAGFKDLQWIRPVFAGETVDYAVTLLSSRPLASRPGRILNTILCEGHVAGVPVVRFESSVLEFE